MEVRPVLLPVAEFLEFLDTGEDKKRDLEPQYEHDTIRCLGAESGTPVYARTCRAPKIKIASSTKKGGSPNLPNVAAYFRPACEFTTVVYRTTSFPSRSVYTKKIRLRRLLLL